MIRLKGLHYKYLKKNYLKRYYLKEYFKVFSNKYILIIKSYLKACGIAHY